LLEERDELHALMRFELVGGDTQSADQTVKQRPALDRQKRKGNHTVLLGLKRFSSKREEMATQLTLRVTARKVLRK